MSSFHSPNDDSILNQGSSSKEHVEHDFVFEKSHIAAVADEDTRDSPRPLLQREETASESVVGDDDTWDSTDWLPNTAEQHATLLTSSLLEFAYNVKAAEHLNRAQGTNRFHRESPEVKTLGAIMFKGASKVLASSGILADCVHEDSWKEMRQQYIIGVDNLGFQAFNESMSRRPSSPRSRLGHQDNEVVIRNASRPRQEFSSVLSSTYLPGRFADVNQRREMMAAMIRNLAVPTPHADLQLSPRRSAASGNRYRDDFWELKRLGRGGFGTVYHVKNFVDNQDYAIKKVPLDSQRMKKWRTNGAKEIETILKEIRTLARLEHSNIVRYYAAWIENGDEKMPLARNYMDSRQLYLEDKPAASDSSGLPRKQRWEMPDQRWGDDDSIEAAFRRRGPSCSKNISNAEHDDSMGIVFGEDSDALSQTHDMSPRRHELPTPRTHVEALGDSPSSASSSANETDIFTDGEGEVRSTKLKKADASTQPLMVLHIQMSLHPLSLSTYLACSDAESGPGHARHCFHLGPSLRLVRAILSGVEYLHSQGIIHRDIKPGNIFLSEHGEFDQQPGCIEVNCGECKHANTKRYLNPRIGDFGLVADLSDSNDQATAAETSCFKSKAVGTEFYRPPLSSQQHPTQSVDEKLDVFALGVLLFELLWKMNTRMERHMLLSNLSKKGILPDGFAGRIDPRSGGGTSKMADGAHVRDGDGSGTVGQRVEDCIRNMVAPSSTKRWSCARVREKLDEVILLLD